MTEMTEIQKDNNLLEQIVKEHFEFKKDHYGADIKILQYEEYAKVKDITQINLTEILNLNLNLNLNCIMINLEKDIERYNSATKELNKIGIHNFVHLKGTYWKTKNVLSSDLTNIINFLSNFTQIQNLHAITFDQFSRASDPNIKIQDGPLACYCSHLRAMQYGYENFSHYTIIIEDDISITNTQNIELCIKEIIKSEWDIILLNANPKSFKYSVNQKLPYYKLTGPFHSTHFYIINNKCFTTLFKNLYPITDQVDDLIARLYDKLIIYNIEDCVYQKNFSTNTQNNINAIFTSPNYKDMKNLLINLPNNLFKIISKKLPSNDEYNMYISDYLIYNVIYLHLFGVQEISPEYLNHPNYDIDETINENLFDNLPDNELNANLYILLKCCKKGINILNTAKCLISNCLNIIDKFDMHLKYDLEFNEQLHAYDYGSTCQVYILEKSSVIVKKYNQKLRWVGSDHSNIEDIFNNEVQELKKLNLSYLNIDYDNKIIKMPYLGKSLFRNFNLPTDYVEQLNNIFKDLSICTEFKLENILINNNNKIHLVDYGLINCTPSEYIDSLKKIKENYDPYTNNLKEIYFTFNKNKLLASKLIN